MNITNGGKRNGDNPLLVRLTTAVNATVNRGRSCPVVLTLTELTPRMSIVDVGGLLSLKSRLNFAYLPEIPRQVLPHFLGYLFASTCDTASNSFVSIALFWYHPLEALKFGFPFGYNSGNNVLTLLLFVSLFDS